ncbi:DUF1190 domain-containing protein [Methylocystis sp. MJC1]|jgi:uncharacterized protein YgiB involved in biofilm formation|uniref:DUF1190 domain-containing protein n=1 Tax=Methylocystis sp. MJC1 TaxID=2654282 RepID=UPI0013ED4F0D|nr:DUF1190 domain-containing protein [Methylocystis sp. MJC1]KAF2990371.1 hypothetical protein MJC1_02470 [Methylocystis sp. MJC1]MBU6528165.1 DUF1190 domain-containing protein [Methylocystis sp. MJC1]UZX11076.1 DUF1190 domain-containing protein [Methylocystis sp. MJC1]
MANSPLKLIVILVALAAAGFSFFYARRTAPACAEDGKYMSSMSDCQAWGFTSALCKQAVDKAQAVAAHAAPKTETMFQCELRFSDCFENPAGGFTPRPAFCLRTDGEPKEIRYLEYESDRRNRKKTKEVRID